MTAPALFLDRDGTLAWPYHYPSRPEHLRLYPDLAPELTWFQARGWRLVVVTNQSGLARGYFDAAALERLHAHLRTMLAAAGVRLDAIYHCPHHPQGVVPGLARACDCRKPAPGLLLRAAGELGLDLAASWMIGDILDDVEAGHRAGCRAVLVDLGTEPRPTTALRWPDYVARDTRHALRLVRAVETGDPTVERDYLPAAWCPAGVPAQTTSRRCG
ncbi:MAG: HAD family hydrolase [Chloroflexi bacterium]|nr:HAD family hydrolase [Chloroflexota bacterium]